MANVSLKENLIQVCNSFTCRKEIIITITIFIVVVKNNSSSSNIMLSALLSFIISSYKKSWELRAFLTLSFIKSSQRLCWIDVIVMPIFIDEEIELREIR